MKTIDALKPTLINFIPEFTRARALHPALVPYATPAECLAALALSAPTTDEARDAITLALVSEHLRTRGRPLWQSLLLVAYEPMLANVRRRLLDRRDAESRIVLAFLEAIAHLSVEAPPSRVALHLRHATERGAFGAVAARQAEPKTIPLSKARNEPAPEALDAQIERREQMEKVVSALNDLFADPGVAAEMLDVLLHARTGREPLERLVADRHPELGPRARAAIYSRWQRQRRRALAHLEAYFGPELEAALAA
jgi:hypothetical protein